MEGRNRQSARTLGVKMSVEYQEQATYSTNHGEACQRFLAQRNTVPLSRRLGRSLLENTSITRFGNKSYRRCGSCPLSQSRLAIILDYHRLLTGEAA